MQTMCNVVQQSLLCAVTTTQGQGRGARLPPFPISNEAERTGEALMIVPGGSPAAPRCAWRGRQLRSRGGGSLVSHQSSQREREGEGVFFNIRKTGMSSDVKPLFFITSQL